MTDVMDERSLGWLSVLVVLVHHPAGSNKKRESISIYTRFSVGNAISNRHSRLNDEAVVDDPYRACWLSVMQHSNVIKEQL